MLSVILPAVRVPFGAPALAGIIFRGSMPDRVALFIDYQNTYRSARRAFYDNTWPSPYGQIHPAGLGAMITKLSPWPRALETVRVYRGLPDSSKDPRGYGAARRQISAWEAQPYTTVIRRPLRYPDTYPTDPPEEKGIDVKLAIDFVMMAVRGAYDIGILVTTDTDLKPALEETLALGSVHVEVASFSPGPDRHGRRLSVSGKKIWCHWIDEQVFKTIEDLTDYNIS